MALGNTESGLMTEGDYHADESAEALTAIIESETEPEPVNKWALRDRLRSRVLWAAILGCLITVCSAFDLWNKIGITAEGFREIAASVGAVLAAFGVFNDPTNREGF